MKEIIQDKPLVSKASVEENIIIANQTNKITSADEEGLMELESYSTFHYLKDDNITKENIQEEIKEEEQGAPTLELAMLNLNGNIQLAQTTTINIETLEIDIANLDIEPFTHQKYVQIEPIENQTADEYISYIQQLKAKIDKGEENVLFEKEWYL